MTQANPNVVKRSGVPVHAGLRKIATISAVSVAAILIIVKLFAYFATNSVSILASLIDSTIDIFSSLVLMFGVLHAVQPADKEHRYGHGKFESLAALVQAVFITGSVVFLFYESLHRFVHPAELEKTYIGVLVMIVSIVLTLILVIFQHYVIKKTDSHAVAADHLHYKGDLLMNVAVIVALGLTHFSNWPYFDPVFAFVIGGVLLHGAWGIGREAMDVLLDKELSEEDREKIYNIVLTHSDVKGLHDLRTRSSGHQVFIEFHMEMDGNLTLDRAHDVTEDVERMLYHEFAESEVIIHQEPAGIDDDRLDERVGDPEPFEG